MTFLCFMQKLSAIFDRFKTQGIIFWHFTCNQILRIFKKYLSDLSLIFPQFSKFFDLCLAFWISLFLQDFKYLFCIVWIRSANLSILSKFHSNWGCADVKRTAKSFNRIFSIKFPSMLKLKLKWPRRGHGNSSFRLFLLRHT